MGWAHWTGSRWIGWAHWLANLWGAMGLSCINSPFLGENLTSSSIDIVQDRSQPYKLLIFYSISIFFACMGEQSLAVASDFTLVERGRKPLMPWSFLEGCETEKNKEIKSKLSFVAKRQPNVNFVAVSKLLDSSLEGERPHIILHVSS